MPLYRRYNQPGKDAGGRVFGFDDLCGEKGRYGQQLKTACLLAAGRPPKAPLVCPRCLQAAVFDSVLCYKYGIAGAWNMICRRCNMVHMPEQEGPSEANLEGIELIRQRDLEAREARKKKLALARSEKKVAKGKKARERVVAEPGRDASAPKNTGKVSDRTKQKTSRPRERERDSGHPERPFGIISNASKISNARSQPAFEAHANNEFSAHDAVADHDQLGLPDIRTIVIIVWEKPGTPPIVDRLEIPSGNQIFLYHNPRVRALPPPTEFERWVFDGNVWSPIPWDITPLEVCPDDDVVFVRVLGICCSGFGEQLRAYQARRGLALTAPHRLGDTLFDPPPLHRWILLWMEDFSPPEVFLVDAARGVGFTNDQAIATPWLDKLRDAPFFVVWHEIQTRWFGVLGDRSPNLPEDTPMLLLAHPGVAMRVGSGEAIAWLEKWRARHQPARTTSDRSNAHSKRSNTDAEKTVATKRARRESPITSDDEPEFIEGPPLVGRTSRLPVSRASTLAGDSRANPLTLSDDEPEFVQGSSSSPHKGKKRSDAHGRKAEKEPKRDYNGRQIIDLTFTDP